MNIKIDVTGNATGTLSKISKNANSADSAMSALSRSISDTNKSLRGLKNLGLAYVALGSSISLAKKALADFSDLQQKSLEISKTTGLEGADLTSFTDSLDRLNQSTRGMNLDALYEISSIAGQLGIKGKRNILAFTTEIQKIAKTSKLTAEQAGEGFAKLLNSLQLNVSSIGNLTSSFTALASSTTASEVSLLDYTQRLAGAGKLLGLTASEIAGIGATLNDVGLTAEVAGTAMSSVFLKMVKDSDSFASAVGLNMESFAKSINEKPVKALEDFLQQLGKLDKAGKVRVLDELKLSGSGLSSTLLKLSTNTKKLTQNIQTSNKAFKENTATTREFNIGTKSLATSQQQLADSIKRASASIGSALAPALESAISSLNGLANYVANNSQGLIDLTEYIGGVTLALVVLKKTIGVSPLGLFITGVSMAIVKSDALAQSIAQNILYTERFNRLTKAKANLEVSNNKVRERALKRQIELKKQESLLLDAINRVSSQDSSKLQIKALERLGRRYGQIQTQIQGAKEVSEELGITWDETTKKLSREIKIKKIVLPKIKPLSIAKINTKKITTDLNKIKRQKEKIDREQLERDRKRLDSLNRFNDEYNRATKTVIEYNFEVLNKQRNDWLTQGIDASRVQEWYIAKAREIAKTQTETMAEQANNAVKQLGLEDEKIKKIEKQITLMDEFGAELSGIAVNFASAILDGFGETGDLNQSVVNATSSNAVQDSLASSSIPLLQAMGVAGKVLSGLLSTTLDFKANQHQDNKTITGITSTVASIGTTSNEYLIRIRDNTKEMNKGLLGLAKSLYKSSTVGSNTFQDSTGTNEALTDYIGTALNVYTLGLGGKYAEAVSSLFYNTSSSLEARGLTFNTVMANQLDSFQASSFQLIRDQSNYLFGLVHSSSERLQTEQVNGATNTAIQSILSSGVKTILDSAQTATQRDLTKELNSIEITLGNIDIKGKSEEEIQALLSSEVGNTLDNVARSLVGDAVESYRIAGQGYAETLVNVATQLEQANDRLKSIGVEGGVTLFELTQGYSHTSSAYFDTIKTALIKNETLFKEVTYTFEQQMEFARIGVSPKRRVEVLFSGIREIIVGFEGTGDALLDLYTSLIEAQTAFRNLRTESQDLTKDLYEAFGEDTKKLASLHQSIYDNFTSDQQKFVDLRNKLNQTFTDGIPETKQAYLDIIKNFNTDGAENAKKYAEVVKASTDVLGYINTLETQRKALAKIEEDKIKAEQINQTQTDSTASLLQLKEDEAKRIKIQTNAEILALESANERLEIETQTLQDIIDNKKIEADKIIQIEQEKADKIAQFVEDQKREYESMISSVSLSLQGAIRGIDNTVSTLKKSSNIDTQASLVDNLLRYNDLKSSISVLSSSSDPSAYKDISTKVSELDSLALTLNGQNVNLNSSLIRDLEDIKNKVNGANDNILEIQRNEKLDVLVEQISSILGEAKDSKVSLQEIRDFMEQTAYK